MKRTLQVSFAILVLVALASLRLPHPSRALRARSSAPTNAAAAARLFETPLAFERNDGQETDGNVKYLSHGQGYRLTLSALEADLSVDVVKAAPARTRVTASARMTLVGANRNPLMHADKRLPGEVNYLLSADPHKWRLGVPTFERVRYDAVYPGVDLEYHGSNQQQLEYDFIVAAGADSSPIRLAFGGADWMRLADDGDLVLDFGSVAIRERKPVAYQLVRGQRVTVDARYVEDAAGQIGFALGEYDHAAPLVIDPVIAWGDYVEATAGFDEVNGVAVAPNGNVIVVGTDGIGASSSDIGGHVWVTGYQPDGARLFRTFLADESKAVGVSVDHEGNIYVAGTTTSNDFPTRSGAPIPEKPTVEILGAQSFISGDQNGFLSKFDPQGHALKYSTYIGGDGDLMEVGSSFEGEGLLLHKLAGIKLRWTINPGDSNVTGMAVDPATERVYLSGWTYSGAFPTTNNGALPDAPTDFLGLPVQSGFVIVLDTTIKGQDSIRYGSYLGTECATVANAIAVDGSGNALVTGSTTASGDDASQVLCGGASYPTSPSAANTTGDGWVTGLPNPDRAVTNGVLFSTYLSGPGRRVAPGLNGAVDVLEDRGGDIVLTEIRGNGKNQQDLHDLGTSTHGAYALARVDVIGNPGLLLAYNAGGSAVNVGRYDLVHSVFRSAENVIGNPSSPGTLVTSVAGDAQNAYIGAFTVNGGLPTVGNSHAGGDDGYIAKFVYNPPPTLSSVASLAGSEGVQFGPVTVATFTDQASLVSVSGSVTVNWGDNTSSAGTLSVNLDNTGTISGTHFYRDEGSYTGQVCLTQGSGVAPACAPLQANVDDVIPALGPVNLTVTASTASAVYRGVPGGVEVTLNQVATINDPHTTDIYRPTTIDWGDGQGPLPADVVQATRQFAPAKHVYTSDGVKNVTACATDDDGFKGCAPAFQLTVPTADVSIQATNTPSSVSICTPSTFQFTVKNNSPDTTAPNVTVTSQVTDTSHMTFTSAFITPGSGTATDTFATELVAPDIIQGSPTNSGIGGVVAVGGDTAVVGGFASDPPRVLQFDSHTMTWQYVQDLPVSNGSIGATALAIDGATIVKGDMGQNAALVYTRSGSTWSLAQTLRPGETLTRPSFGASVAIRGDKIAVGNVVGGDGSGEVLLFKRVSGTWQFDMTLTIPGLPRGAGGSSLEFGRAVAFSDDGQTLFVGVPGYSAENPNSIGGLVLIYQGGPGQWTQTQVLLSPDGNATKYNNTTFDGEAFGLTLASSGNTLLVGAPNHSEGCDGSNCDLAAEGAVYRYQFVQGFTNKLVYSGGGFLFQTSFSSWAFQSTLEPADPVSSDYFGETLGVSGPMAVIGTSTRLTAPPLTDFNFTGNNAAYLFVQGSDGNWVQNAKLQANGGVQFGSSVAIDQGRIVVGDFGGGTAYGYTSCLQTQPGVLSCDLGDLGPGQTSSFALTTSLGSGVGSSAGITASVTAGAIDQSPSNNTVNPTAPVSSSAGVCTPGVAPVVTPTVSGTLGQNNWYTSNVTVHWTETDPHATITTPACSDQNLTADTSGTTAACTATSADGTTTGQVTIKRDATPPTITPSIVSSPDGQGVTVTFACADSGSGIATCTGPVSAPAGTIVTGAATDMAGNSAIATVDVPRANAGGPQIVPVGAGCAAAVQLDGTGSFDPNHEALTYSWSSPAFGTRTGATPVVTLGPGTYSVQLTVTNADGISSTGTTTIAVQSPNPPAFAVNSIPAPITKQATGTLTPVSLDMPVATDSCRVTVTSDAPDSFSEGRTDVLFTATDSAGNVTTAATTVTIVPRVDLAITASTADAVISGSPVQYVVTVSNAGPSAATQVSVATQIPSGLTLVPIPSTTPACIPNTDGSTTCQPVNLSPSQVPAGCTLNGSALTCQPDFLPPNLNACTPTPGASTCTAPVQYSTSAACTVDGSTVTCAPGRIAAGQRVMFALTFQSPADGSGPQTIPASVSTSASVNGLQEEASGDLANNSTSSTVELVRVTDLGLAISAQASVVAGTDLALTMTVTNAGPSGSAGSTLTSNLPAGTSFKSGPGCTSAAGTISCAIGPIARGASVSVPLTLTVSGAARSPIAISASIAGPDVDNNTANNQQTASVPVAVQVNVSAALAAQGPAIAGRNVPMSATIGNAGPSDATGVALALLRLPAGVTLVAPPPGCSASGGGFICPGLSLPGAGAAVFPFTVALGQFDRGSIVETISVTDAEETASHVAQQTLAIQAVVAPSLAVQASPAKAIAGRPLVYTLTAANGGPSGATNVVLDAPVPARTSLMSASALLFINGGPGTPVACSGSAVVECVAPTLGTTDRLVLTMTVAVNSSALAQGTRLAGTATLSAAESGTPATADLGVDLVASADVQFVSLVPQAPSVDAGSSLAFTATVKNNGPSDASQAAITIPLPSDHSWQAASAGQPAGCSTSSRALTCSLGALASGASASRTIVVVVDPFTRTPIQIAGNASAAEPDPDATNNAASATAQTTAHASVTVDLSASPNPAVAGTPLSYTLHVANAGPSGAAALSTTLVVPAGTTASAPAGCTLVQQTVSCPLANLAPQSHVDLTIVVNVDQFARGIAGALIATAGAHATEMAQDASTSLSTPVTTLADARVSVTAAPNPIVAGNFLKYTITVSNAGPSGAIGSTLTETLPAGLMYVSGTGPGVSCSFSHGLVTCALPNIASGDAVTVKIVAVPATAGLVMSTSTVTVVENDPDLSNNSAGAATTVSSPSAGPSGLGDFNGDGALDLAVSDPHKDIVHIFLNDGQGHFVEHQQVPVGHEPAGLAIGDLDNDGDLDIVVADQGGNAVSVLTNDGTGTFVESARLPTLGQEPVQVALGDFDADGSLDIAALNYQSDDVSIFKRDAAGAWRLGVRLAVAPISATGQRLCGHPEHHPQAIAVADLNGDGTLDIIVGNNGPDSVSLILNRGNWQFAPAAEMTLQYTDDPVSLAVADFDGDGDLDIAVAGKDHGRVSLLVNTNGTFTETLVSGPMEDRPVALAAGDLNGDGRVDLVVAAGDDAAILLNAGGGFPASLATSLEASPKKAIAVMIGDVNGDGTLDIVVVDDKVTVTVWTLTSAPRGGK